MDISKRDLIIDLSKKEKEYQQKLKRFIKDSVRLLELNEKLVMMECKIDLIHVEINTLREKCSDFLNPL
jgi:hypothetical protein